MFYPNNPLQDFVTKILADVVAYTPRVVAFFAVLVLGTICAKIIRNFVVRLLKAIKLEGLIKQTPLELFLKNADALEKIEEILASVLYWLLMLVVLHSSVSLLGLDPLTAVLNGIIAYIPSIFSAILVLFFGVLLAGVVESLVKAAVRSIDGQAARLMGKISSYLVLSVSFLAAVSELGIASEFIQILFIGFVATLALGFGIAFGLGGKDVVSRMLMDWYEKRK